MEKALNLNENTDRNQTCAPCKIECCGKYLEKLNTLSGRWTCLKISLVDSHSWPSNPP